MDSADIAAQNDFNDEAVTRMRADLKKAQVVTRGVCLNCEEPLESDLIYCDTDCRDDHRLQERLAKIKRSI